MRNLIEKDEVIVELWVSRFKYIEKIEKEIMKCGKSELGEWMIRQAFVNEMSNMDIQSVTDIKPVEILTEEDYRELHDRFGDYVEFVIRDMITGKGERWKERTMEDLISRQRAIKAMDTWDKFGCDPNGMLVRYDDDKHYVPYVRYDDMVYVIKSLPSAEPEKGRWDVEHGCLCMTTSMEIYTVVLCVVTKNGIQKGLTTALTVGRRWR